MNTLSPKEHTESWNWEKIKILITDLDNTLWQGILDEKKSGESLFLNTEYYEYIKDLHNKGIQIFVVSKNNKYDVLKEFKIQNIDPNMFTKIIANREPKYLNIKNLLHQLEGVKSEQVIFVDDNPLEREEVEKVVPNIHVVDYIDRKHLFTIPYLNTLEKQQEARIEERKNSYRTWLLDNFKIDEQEDPKFWQLAQAPLILVILFLTTSDNLEFQACNNDWPLVLP